MRSSTVFMVWEEAFQRIKVITSPGIITLQLYDRLLGLECTDFNGRSLQNRLDGKEASQKAREQAGNDRIPNTHPSHPLADYAGKYEDLAYGILDIRLLEEQLEFYFHHIVLPGEVVQMMRSVSPAGVYEYLKK